MVLVTSSIELSFSPGSDAGDPIGVHGEGSSGPGRRGGSVSQGLLDGVASKHGDEAPVAMERLILAAAAIAAGHRGRDAVVEADLVLSHLRGKPERRRSAHQESVRSVELLFAEYSQAPPPPAVIARWIKVVGGVENLAPLLRSLGDAGHLAKGHAYVFAVVSGHGGGGATATSDASAGIKDGTVLPSGMVWSAQKGMALGREEYDAL